MKMVKTTVALSFAAAAIGCNKVDFAPGTEAAVPLQQAPTCRTTNVSQQRPVNVIFLVDQSGSNLNGPYEHPGEATDPQKTLRMRIMSDFLGQHAGKANLRWSLITFNENSANALVANGSANAMNSALGTFSRTTDVGKTPYRAALQMAQQAIAANSASANPNSLTLIAFITDGYPTDYCPGGLAEYECPGRIMESALDADVANLVSTSAGTVQMGTVYYGAQDSAASARLQRMAVRGGGQFVDLNRAGIIDLNDVIEVPQTVCDP